MSMTQKQDAEQQSPAEVAAILEQAADHAGASASTYRQLAALMKEPRFAAGIPAPGGIDIAKALRDAYGRGHAHAMTAASQESEKFSDYCEKRDAWVAQYMARSPGAAPVDIDALRKRLAEAWQENSELRGRLAKTEDAQFILKEALDGARSEMAALRQQISDIYNAQNG